MPSQIEAYLRGSGWEAVERRDASVRWVDHERERSLVSLRDPKDPDYEDFLAVLFARLTEIEDRDLELIWRDIFEAGRDTLLLRVVAPSVTNGEVPMAYGTELFNGVRDLIVASGRSLGSTRANFAGPTPDNIIELLDRMTFGETRKGSYVVTVRTPVDQQLALGADSVLSLDRQALARTMEAVAAAQTAAEHLDDDDTIDTSIERGLSAQLCKALSRIDPETTGVTVEMKTKWAAGLPAPAQTVPARVALHSTDFAHLRRLGDALSLLEPEEGFVLSGWIKEIKFDALWESSGTVTVEERSKGRRRDIRLELEGHHFDEAHRLAGHGYVRARGTLEKAGRAWVLSLPSEIRFSGDLMPPD